MNKILLSMVGSMLIASGANAAPAVGYAVGVSAAQTAGYATSTKAGAAVALGLGLTNAYKYARLAWIDSVLADPSNTWNFTKREGETDEQYVAALRGDITSEFVGANWHEVFARGIVKSCKQLKSMEYSLVGNGTVTKSISWAMNNSIYCFLPIDTRMNEIASKKRALNRIVSTISGRLTDAERAQFNVILNDANVTSYLNPRVGRFNVSRLA